MKLEVPAWLKKLLTCSECKGTAIYVWFDCGKCRGVYCRSCGNWTDMHVKKTKT